MAVCFFIYMYDLPTYTPGYAMVYTSVSLTLTRVFFESTFSSRVWL